MFRKLSRATGGDAAAASPSNDGSDESKGDSSPSAVDGARKASHASLAFYRSGAARKGSVGRKGSRGRKRSTGSRTDTGGGSNASIPLASHSADPGVASSPLAASAPASSSSPPPPPRAASTGGAETSMTPAQHSALEYCAGEFRAVLDELVDDRGRYSDTFLLGMVHAQQGGAPDRRTPRWQ